jgi:hypothetical protein
LKFVTDNLATVIIVVQGFDDKLDIHADPQILEFTAGIQGLNAHPLGQLDPPEGKGNGAAVIARGALHNYREAEYFSP